MRLARGTNSLSRSGFWFSIFPARGHRFITAFVDAASPESVTRTGYTLIIDQRRSTGQFVHAGELESRTGGEPCRLPTEAASAGRTARHASRPERGIRVRIGSRKLSRRRRGRIDETPAASRKPIDRS